MYVPKRVVPWFCISEYEQVANSLKSSDLSVIKEAVRIMRIWLCRVNVSKIPRSILCTYELMVARLEQSTPALALAIMRFISLASSEDQDRLRSPQAIPVSSLAKKAGLPDWMSDLRNDIAHGHLPTYAFLSETYSVCMDWLNEFWQCNLPTAEMDLSINTADEVDWNHYSPEKLTEDLDSPLQARILEHSFGAYASGLINGGSLEPEHLHSLKKILRIFKHKNRICDVALNAFFRVTGSDDGGALQWARLWLDAFLAVRDGNNSALSEFLRPCDLSTFEWRPCLEHLCSVFSPEVGTILPAVLELCHPRLPVSRRDAVLGLCGVGQRPSLKRAHEGVCKWKLERSVQWWRLPIGVFPTCNHASSGRRNQRFPHQDPQVGRKIGEDQDQQGQCKIQDPLQPLPLHSGGYRKGKGRKNQACHPSKSHRYRHIRPFASIKVPK